LHLRAVEVGENRSELWMCGKSRQMLGDDPSGAAPLLRIDGFAADT
jgi:hypothetical protein